MIVVALGHRLTDPTIHPHLRRRVNAAVDAYQATSASALLVSGGRRNEAVDRSEAAVMYEHARERGVPATRLLAEDHSLDTIGNAYFTRCLLDRREISPETLLLVTADQHADRAAFAFEQCFEDVEIDASVTVEAPRTESGHDEGEQSGAGPRTRMDRTRTFFEPVEPGDRIAIARRLVDTHDCYGPGDVADAVDETFPRRSV
ncbi:YdcF family protein [Halobacteria archaeon AArc-dxtr1]|nr:YdcF family protein [Halobacteria archaeon AArc-dxtr1]